MFQKQWRYFKVTLKRVFTQKKNTPTAIARGAMVGVFFGMTPSVGFQILPAILLTTLLKGNRIVAVTMTFVSNPITVLPIYAIDFFIGKLILPGMTNVSFSRIEDLVIAFTFAKLVAIGYETILVLWMGGLVIAFPTAVITYYIFLFLVSSFQKNLRLKRERREKREKNIFDLNVHQDMQFKKETQSKQKKEKTI